jgi:hypothetical protein
MQLLLVAATGALLVGAAVGRYGQGGKKARALPRLPANTTSAPVELLEARPFLFDRAETHTWRSDAPLYDAGFLLVLHADPDLVRPRQTYDAVLYVGGQTAERCNVGATTGNLVVLVPAPRGAGGTVALDPWSVPIWFGPPELPERIDAVAIQRELAAARRSGVGPASAAIPRRAQSPATTIYAQDRADLDFFVADLIETYSADEVDLVRGLRVPVTR